MLSNVKNELKKLLNSSKEEFSRFIEDDFDVSIKHAVELAYKDLQWRTIKGHNTNSKESNIKSITKVIVDKIYNDTIDLINEVEKIFDKDFGSLDKNQCFGKAQKVVNMTFKYLYCLDKDNRLKVDYTNRDIPLDDRILDYYRKFINNDRKISSWSCIKKEDYKEIQENFDKYIKEKLSGLNKIEAEFIIWNYATVYLAEREYENHKKRYEDFKKSQKTAYCCYEYIKSLQDNKKRPI